MVEFLVLKEPPSSARFSAPPNLDARALPHRSAPLPRSGFVLCLKAAVGSCSMLSSSRRRPRLVAVSMLPRSPHAAYCHLASIGKSLHVSPVNSEAAVPLCSHGT
jgi:hypothetical protein